MLVRYEDEKLQLDEIWSSDWAVIQRMIIERHIYKKEVAEQSERIARLSGNSKNKSAFPNIR